MAKRWGRRWSAVAAMTMGSVGVAACGSGAGVDVVMRLIAYKPSKLEVAVGSTVTWKQQDAGHHTVTSGSVTKDQTGSVATHADGTFTSGQLAKGEEFTVTFDEAGTSAYFCEIHPATMSGEVIVR